MSETNRPRQARNHGFTIVEMLVIAPIVILTIGAFVGVIISMTGEVLATRTSNVMAYGIQDTLSRIEADIKLSTTLLEANHVGLIAPQGFNNDTTSFANVSASSGNMLILNVWTGVYLANQPNACTSPQVNQNAPMMKNIVYFLKDDGAGTSTYTLWRRTVMPTDYAAAGCGVPGGASCAPGQVAAVCKTQDIRLIDKLKVSDFAVQYFNTADSTVANVTASNAAALPSDRYDQLKLATTVGVTLNVAKTAAGRDVTQTGTVRVTKLDGNAALLAVPVAVTVPAAPTVTASISDPNSTLFPDPTFKYPAAVFTWPAVPGATSYTMQYQINGGALTAVVPATACIDTKTCAVNAPRNSIVRAEVTATNSAGTSGIGSVSITNLAWTNLLTQNKWDDYNQSGYSTAAYTKTSSGIVMLKGVLKRSGALSAGEFIGSLPVGYRPSYFYNSFLTSTSPNAISRIDVNWSGNISIASGSSTWVSLDGIKFIANDSIYAFTAPTLSNGWVVNTGSYTAPGYTVDGSGRTYVQGGVTSGTVTDGTLIATLPAAYRPSEYLTLPAFNNGFGMIGIDPVATGVVAKGGVNTLLSLNSMFYPNTYAGWTNLTLQNGWVWNGTVYSTPQYTKAADGIVTLKGRISGGTAAAGTVIANLPAGYRPKQNLMQTVASNGVYGRVDVTTTGDITVQLASNAWLSLDGISFIYDP